MKRISIWLVLVWSAWGGLSARPAAAQQAGPLSYTNLVGSTIELVGMSGDGISGYQWVKDGTNLVDDARTSGSLTPTLTVTSSEFGDTGSYVETAGFGTNGAVLLTNFVVYVVDQPEIQTFETLNSGSTLTFSVGATGGLLSYQWFWQGQPVPGATNSALVYSNAYATASAGYYSVVITNPVGQVSSPAPGLLFTKPAPQGTYQGLFFDTNSDNVALGSSGFFQFTVSSAQRSFSGRIVMLTQSYPFSGTFSLAHDCQVTVKRPNRSAMTLALQMVATNNTAQLFGTLSADIWSSALRGNLVFYSGRNLYPLPGRYTLSLQDTNFPVGTGPDGAGYGVVNIARNGTVTLSGQAADGVAINQSCGLSKNGDWPFYSVMYGGAGCVFGWLSVQSQAGSSILGHDIHWIKLPLPGRLYPGGISANLEAQGSTFSTTGGVPVLPFALGVAGFSGGDLVSGDFPLWDFVRISRPNAAGFFVAEPSAETPLFYVNRGNGIVSGGFTDPATGRRAQLKGVVLQQQNMAAGYFISTNSSGYFTLAPSQ